MLFIIYCYHYSEITLHELQDCSLTRALAEGYSNLSVCVSVCYLIILKIASFSLLVEPIAGKSVSPSDKQLWRFLKKFLGKNAHTLLIYNIFKAEL